MTNSFHVDGWRVAGPIVTLSYTVGDTTFEEHLTFPSSINLTPTAERILTLLAVVAGVSYAKAYAPTHVSLRGTALTEAEMTLVRQTYDQGMREFAYTNALPLTNCFTLTDEAIVAPKTSSQESNAGTPLLPFGGGRDSCVVATALHHLSPTLFTVGDNPYARSVANGLQLPYITVSRTIDPQLIAMNDSGAPNGHVPVTAINSLIALLVAETAGHSSVVMANEKSASQPTRIVNGIEVNHQHSKSDTYEQALREAVRSTGSSVQYLSVLRNSPDAAIAKAFALKCVTVHQLFMSCNRAMVRDHNKRSHGWCKQCPKCRGIFLSLAPYMTPDKLSTIFGEDLLDNPTHISGFRDLAHDDTKPFECVADVKEAQHSMALLQNHPMWSRHAVVQACADLAHLQPLEHNVGRGHHPLVDEVNRFMEVFE